MAKLFDESGKEVEGAMTKEEHDAAVKAATEEALKKATENPEETPEQKAAREDKEKGDANEAKGLNRDGSQKAKPGETAEERIARLEANETARRTREAAMQYAGNDPEKIKQFETKFGRLTNYPDTPEGWAERAKDAAVMAFGKAESIDMRGAGDGGGRGEGGDTKPAPTQADATLGKMFGISDADRAKFGGDKS